MDTDTIADLILVGLPGAEVAVKGDGSHFQALVTSDAFTGLTPIQRQRLVLDSVRSELSSGALHALSIKTQTRAERKQHGGLVFDV